MRCSILFPVFVLVVNVDGQSLLGSGSGGGGGSYLPIGVLNGLTGLESTLNSDPVEHPRDFEPRVLLGLGACLQLADLANSSGNAEANSYPWVGGMLEAGGSLTYRDRLGMALQASWGLNGYMLSLDSVVNKIYHGTKRAEARLWWLPRARPFAPSQWKFGLALGCTFQRADDLVRERDGFRSVTSAPYSVRPYLAPEFGRIGAEGKDRFETSLRYVVHLDGDKAWGTQASIGGSEATFNASDNYLGIVTRYHIGFKREGPPVPPPLVLPYQDRRTDTLVVLRTHQRRITVRLWDDAEVDGDTISVFLNEVPVLSGHGLAKKPLRLALDLQRGWNRLLIVAHNEGSVSPNTASCIVRRGRGKEKLLIKTSRKHDQLVVIRNE